MHALAPHLNSASRDHSCLLVPSPLKSESFCILFVNALYKYCLKGGRVRIAFFVNYSTVAFPLHLPTLKRQQFFGAVANSLGKNSYFPLPLDVRRCVAPTGEEVDARQRGVNWFMRNGLLEAWLATLRQNLLPFF